jgi:hypothetical protein
MTIADLIFVIVVVGLLVYLGWALIAPEDLG